MGYLLENVAACWYLYDSKKCLALQKLYPTWDIENPYHITMLKHEPLSHVSENKISSNHYTYNWEHRGFAFLQPICENSLWKESRTIRTWYWKNDKCQLLRILQKYLRVFHLFDLTIFERQWSAHYTTTLVAEWLVMRALDEEVTGLIPGKTHLGN